ncbi:UvrD-helicase domain-containing protein [Adlercreutzia caecimuris]|uniref:UvrD-helicase domain-containing protein n=1 Tax=Adlercreutzia caecimuris TaxID=671266 RepID=UPI002494F23E|nr:UvrD-helicase domain-containing protein [Adlercreutzia caecimuris]
MNLDRCTEGQRAVVTTLDAPLMVSAGAGSGKTFTLTQRVAFALSPEAGGAGLTSVDELLAITFTTKAAAELKGRIKGLLLSEGLEAEALKVDDAWVSTIHGMAARILREHALEVGLDPAFQVIGEVEADELLAEAAERVVARAREAGAGPVHELLSREKLSGSSFNDRGAVDFALAVAERVHAMPRGFEGLVEAPDPVSPSLVVRCACEAAAEMRAAAEAWSKPSKTKVAFLERLEAAVEAAEAWLADAPAAGFADAGFDADRFGAVFYGFPLTTGAAVGKADAPAFEAWQTAMVEIEREVRAGLSVRWQTAVTMLAREIEEEFARVKGPSRLDNGDLLTRCAAALSEHPSIAASLRARFKIIMVDEFQDTDRLQVDIIGRIARPGFANVCTVGDAQQSIYRFRGADVNVFTEYRSDLRARAGQEALVQLDWNFRSHGDVLALVERIFSQPTVFGDDFLRLEARGAVSKESDALFDGGARPRVSLSAVHYPARGFDASRARDAGAEAVAEHFAELAAAGARPGQMVILLGKMTHAHRYAAALRARGIPSMIAGGSVFSRLPEPALVSALLRWAVNATDDEALYQVLASPLFAVSDDVLLALASSTGDDGSVHRRRLAAGFLSPQWDDEARALGLSENDLAAFTMARRQLLAFARRARAGDATGALRGLLVGSGLLDRLQDAGVDGLAQGANLAKALRLAADMEAASQGIASLAAAFDAHLACAKEAPGALAAAEGDFVRIMTVHASKGLEFPHVAVADLKDGRESAGPLVVENVGTFSFAAASRVPEGAFADAAAKYDRQAKKLGLDDDDELLALFEDAASAPDRLRALTCGRRYGALAAYARAQALAEARRLLYVALTRASRSLFVSMVFKRDPAKGYGDTGIFEDIHDALPWGCEGARAVSELDYGGSAPARVVFRQLGAEEDAEGTEDADSSADAGHLGDPGACGGGEADGGAGEGGGSGEDSGDAFVVAVREELPAPALLPCNFARAQLYSYTSLSGTHAHSDEPATEDEEEAAVPAPAPASEAIAGQEGNVTPESATALGTAFHRLAQQAIERSEQGALFTPGEAAIAAQIQKEGLSTGQQERLRQALDRWLASDEAARFAAYENRAAEVSFIVQVPASPSDGSAAGVWESFFLEGEIDGLADNGDGAAFLIDYKTGGRDDETDAELDAKHRLQASCYAYALMRAGYTSVEAHFLRIERPSAENPRDPQIVPYHFETADLPALEALIIGKQKEATA